MEIKGIRIKRVGKKPIYAGDIFPVSEPFNSALNFVKKNMRDMGFMDFIDKSMGCSNPIVRTLILNNNRINPLRTDIYEVWDKETNSLMGYTIPALVELIGVINIYKENKSKIMRRVKEKINPVNFSESNKTLSGEGGEIDDLRVFNDGVQSVSCWKVNLWGLLKLLFTRKIWLGVMAGNSQPPVWISVDYPFKKK